MIICTRCANENPDGFRFCPACGAPLPAVAVRQTRKVVTALFCDVTGSTALGERLDPEYLRGVLARYFSELRTIIERHGGRVEKFIGDAVVAFFGIPRLHEDDALRAVRAAAEIRERLPTLAQEVGLALQFRTGINTGAVVSADDGTPAIGDAVNVAARLEQTAPPGGIVLGAQTLQLVRDAVEVEPLAPLLLKGKSAPVAAYRLISVDPAAPGLARRLDGPLVGRERELGVLRDVWQRSSRERSCRVFSLLGPAGVGKSRLAEELLREQQADAWVLRGRCPPYGEGITFWPLIEALTPLQAPAQGVLARLDHGGVAAAEELFWEVRRFLQGLASQRPLILYVDDLHWAQPMLLDLLDHVADLSEGAPILLLGTARPELLEDRPGWGAKDNATTMLLEPLSSRDSELLLALLGDGLDRQARTRVIAASAGNPLFLEEMAALAHDRGTTAVPPTIQALLATRLERLVAQERELLERGAIEGEVFHRLALRALSGVQLEDEVEPALAALMRKQLIRPHPATFAGDEAFRFRHLLIRDAAYEALPKVQRAQLHERFADWIEQVGAGLGDLEEIAGWHLEQTLRYQRELGVAAAPVLQRRVARHLRAAASHARARMDEAAARGLLERALALAPADGPADQALADAIAVDLAEQLLDAFELDRAEQLLPVAARDPAVARRAALVALERLILVRPHEALPAIESQLPGMLEQFAGDGDERSLARAHLAGQWVHWLAGRATAAGEQAGVAAEHAHAAGDARLRARAISYQLEGLILGRQPAQEIALRLDALEREEPGPYLAATIKRARATVRRLEGRFAEARELLALAEDDLAALGMPTTSAYDHMRSATLELAAGDLAAALAPLQRGDEDLARQGERAYRATIQALMGEVHDLLGDPDAARIASDLAEELSLPDDVMNLAITHGVRARLALRDGDGEAAERWARGALAMTLPTDFVLDQARARLNLAHVLAGLGRSEEAATEARGALELHAAKGDRPGTDSAQAFLAALGAWVSDGVAAGRS